MKKFLKVIMLFIFMPIFLYSVNLSARELPSVKIKDLHNRTVDTKTFNNDGKPFVICFWATWCKPCLEELKAYDELYDEWQEDYGIKIIAISIDNSRSSRKVAPFAKGKGWKFDIYLDENQDFSRNMNVTNPPHTFIVNGKGEIVWSHIGYAMGDEDGLIKAYKKVLADEAKSKTDDKTGNESNDSNKKH